MVSFQAVSFSCLFFSRRKTSRPLTAYRCALTMDCMVLCTYPVVMVGKKSWWKYLRTLPCNFEPPGHLPDDQVLPPSSRARRWRFLVETCCHYGHGLIFPNSSSRRRRLAWRVCLSLSLVPPPSSRVRWLRQRRRLVEECCRWRRRRRGSAGRRRGRRVSGSSEQRRVPVPSFDGQTTHVARRRCGSVWTDQGMMLVNVFRFDICWLMCLFLELS